MIRAEPIKKPPVVKRVSEPQREAVDPAEFKLWLAHRDEFLAWVAARDKRRAGTSGKAPGRPAKHPDKPWEALGISRRSWYRRQKEGEKR